MSSEVLGSPARRRALTGSGLLAGAAVLWSLNGLFIRWLHQPGLDGWALAGFRSLFACLFVTPLVWRRRGPIADRGWVLATVLCFTAMCATFVHSMTRTTVANALVLQYTAPVWVFLLSPRVTGERATGRQLACLVFALMGVGVIFGGQFRAAPWGLALGLLSGLVFGFQTVLFRRVRAMEPLVLVWLTCGGSGVLLVATAYVTGGVSLRPALLGGLALMGLVQFAIPYVMYSAGLRRVSAQQAVMIILLEPVLSPVWVWASVGEVPQVSTMVGGGFILLSVIYLALVNRSAGGSAGVK